jgi:hypothetical protein
MHVRDQRPQALRLVGHITRVPLTMRASTAQPGPHRRDSLAEHLRLKALSSAPGRTPQITDEVEQEARGAAS